MTVQSRGGPSIAALFLVIFDQQVGYTTAWHRELPDVSIDGVEFKSLPSGLHSVSEDLVYFTLGQHVGVSAFVQGESDDAHRNAEFVSVGALLSRSYGRQGRGWLVAGALEALAREVVGDVHNTRVLEDFWKIHRHGEGERQDSAEAFHRQDSIGQELRSKPSRLKRLSIPTELTDESRISQHHPSFAVTALLDVFGPLIFPLYRAALLRQRILFLGPPPVHQTCDFLYILTVFASSYGSSSEDAVSLRQHEARIEPIFSIGLHDIPLLAQHSGKDGWLACTTDEIFRDKTDLYDILVELPRSGSEVEKRWPALYTHRGHSIKATQRDLRRYKLLRVELQRMRFEQRNFSDAGSSDQTSTDVRPPLDAEEFLERTTPVHAAAVDSEDSTMKGAVEPATWAAAAYEGLIWWTSAADADGYLRAEVEADRALLDNLADIEVSASPSVGNGEEQLRRHRAQAAAAVVVAYFRALTAQILTAMAEVVKEDDADDAGTSAEDDDEDAVMISAETMAKMGLDSWSEADKAFVRQAFRIYHGRNVMVGEEGVRVCGVRIC